MKVINQVENILKVSQKARNSDRELFIIYMNKFGLNLTPAQETKFREMPSLETIRRSRQMLQERGLYLASPHIEQQRYEKYKAMRQGAPYFEEPENIIEITKQLWPE